MINEQQGPRVNITQTAGCICGKCNHNTFTEQMLLRKVSKFVAGSPDDLYIPVPIFVCAKCGEIYTKALPVELRALLNPTEEVEVTEEEEKPQAKIINMFSIEG